MGAMDHQMGVKSEAVYGTPDGAVTDFFEYESENISETYGRTEGDPLRVGSGFVRNDRFTPWIGGAAGTIQMTAMTKGFGFWLNHMMGDAVVTSGPAETVVYTHTASEGELLGESFTAQVNRPFHPSGTDQAFTYSGGKIAKWTLSNSVDGNLLLDLDCDFQTWSTAVALASASYAASMEPFSWVGGFVTIGGSNYDVTEFSLEVDNGLDVDRRQIRANPLKKEPTSSRREASFSISADFDSLDNRNRAASLTRAGALAAVTGVWRGPTLLGSTLYPEFSVSLAAARFDEWSGATEGTDAITQELSGVVRYDGTNSPVEVTYVTADATP
jgi:hypothetical protein